MLEQIKFINHLNESMEWGKNGIYVNYNDLHDFDWSVVSENDKISSFEKGIVTKTIPLIIYCSDKLEGLRIKNQLFEIAEKDILAMQHGRIVIGDYYLKCYITGSAKANYLVHKGYLEVSLTLTTDYPQWVKETKQSFYQKEGSEESGIFKRNFDYNFDYPFDYMSGTYNQTLSNTGLVGTEFEMVIYGACSNPTIYIGGHPYNVNVEIAANEYLTINSITKTIVLTEKTGNKVNCFKHRNKESYIFEKITSGDNAVTWDGDFGFDITLFEERSEPKWT